MIHVRVILHSVLRDLLPPETGGRTDLLLEDGSDLLELYQQLVVPRQAVAAVNGEIVRDLTRELQDGDEVRFFRAGAGGSV